MSVNRSHLRAEYLRSIDEADLIPDFIKPELKEYIVEVFHDMSRVLGLVELTYIRTLRCKDTLSGKEPEEVEDDRTDAED